MSRKGFDWHRSGKKYFILYIISMMVFMLYCPVVYIGFVPPPFETTIILTLEFYTAAALLILVSGTALLLFGLKDLKKNKK